MDNLLKSIAHMLNTTTDELKSVIDVSKENLPQVYHTLVREHASYVIFNNLIRILLIVDSIALVACVVVSIASICVYYEREDKSELKPLVVSSITMIAFTVLTVALFVCRDAFSPNYSFLLEILHKK